MKSPGRAAAGDTSDGHPVDQIHGRWVWAGEFGFDFRGLDVAQVRRLAPFVVEAVWSRDMEGPLMLLHGGERKIAAALRAQWRTGDWMPWSYFYGSKRHSTTPTRILLALRAPPSPPRPRSPLPDLDPESLEYVEHPRCVALTKAGTPCKSPAAPDRPYCIPHDPLRQA